jgi:hypothetical protein
MYKIILIIAFAASVVMGADWLQTTTGNIDDGATFGNTSPGVEGVDYPTLTGGDSVTVKKGATLTIPTGIVFQGKIGLDTGVALGNHTTLSVSGALLLEGNSVRERYTTLRFNEGAYVNGGLSTKYRFILNNYATNGDGYYMFGDNCILRNIGFGRIGQSSRREKVLFDGVTIDSMAACTIFTATDTLYFNNCNLINGALLTITNSSSTKKCELNRCKIVTSTTNGIKIEGAAAFTEGVIIDSCVFINYNSTVATFDVYLPSGSVTNCVFVDYVFTSRSNNTIFSNNLFVGLGKSSVSYSIAAGSRLVNNYIVVTSANPHYVYMSNNVRWINTIFESPHLVGAPDNGDVFFTNDFPDTCHINRTIYLGIRSDAFTNKLGTAADIDTGKCILSNVSYIARSGSYTFHRTETSVGIYEGGHAWNNIIYSKVLGTNTVGWQMGNDQSKWRYVDHNCFWQVDTPYCGNMTIPGITRGEAGFGGSDLVDVNPLFADTGVNFRQFDLLHGGDGNYKNAGVRFADNLLQGTNDNYTFSKLTGYIRNGARIKNQQLKAAGRFGDDIGAVPFILHHIDTMRSNDTLYSIDSLSSALWFSDSTGNYRDSMHVQMMKKTSGSYVLSSSAGLKRAGSRCTTFVKMGAADTVIVMAYGSEQLGGTYFSDTLPVITSEYSSGKTKATITVQPENSTVNEGANATFSITATGSNLQYICYRNGDSIGNTNSKTFATTYAMNGALIRFKVWADTADTVWSNTVTLTVLPTAPEITVDPITDTTTGPVRMFAEWTGTAVNIAWYRLHGTDTTLLSRDSVLQFNATPAMDGDSVIGVLWNITDTVATNKAYIEVVYAVFDSVKTTDSLTVYFHGNFLSGSGWTGTIAGTELTTGSGSATTQSFVSETKFLIKKKKYKITISDGVYSIILYFGQGTQNGGTGVHTGVGVF